MELPAVPMVAMKILNLLDNPNADIDELQAAIMGDQSLAARVLKIANSVYYGAGREIDTISGAVMMMGFESVKNLVLAASTRSIYKKFGLLEQKLWEHSIGVSVASGVLARKVRYQNIEEATVAGLLHDIGKAVMNNNDPDQFLILAEMVYNDRVTYVQREMDIFGFGHAEAGGLFAKKWKFADHLCDVISMHHSYDPTAGTFTKDSRTNTLCTIVALADALCLRLGVGYRGPMDDLVDMDGNWKKTLSLSEKDFEEITDTFKRTYIEEKLLYQA